MGSNFHSKLRRNEIKIEREEDVHMIITKRDESDKRDRRELHDSLSHFQH